MSQIRIEPVPRDEWETALRILFARFPVEEQAGRVDAALGAAAVGKLSFDGLQWALQRDLPVGATLVMPQPDGISLVWPAIVTCAADDPEAVEAGLLEHIGVELDASGAKLGQILFDPDEIADFTAYKQHGFLEETDLFFVARSLGEPIPMADPHTLRVETFSDQNADRFAAVIQASYRGSLDCTWLEGMRTGHEALASHKLSGQWDPSLWRLYGIDSEDAAVLLLNEHPDQDAVELVYFGVTPRNRGRNLGKLLVRDALTQTAARNRPLLFAAVDAKNSYANAIYSAAGFAELARRKALFRRPRGGRAE